MGRQALQVVVTVRYWGVSYSLDLARCRRALVERQVEGEMANMAGLASKIGVSRSTVSRFLAGRNTSLRLTLRILAVLRLEFAEVARAVEERGDA